MSRLKRAANVLEMLKKDLKGEHEAIKMYEKHIDSIDIPEIKSMLEHIKKEEEQHVKELTELIDKHQ